MSCQQVPTAPAFNPYPRSVQVGEFEVAIGGGIWVAIGVSLESSFARQFGRFHQLAVSKREHSRLRNPMAQPAECAGAVPIDEAQ